MLPRWYILGYSLVLLMMGAVMAHGPGPIRAVSASEKTTDSHTHEEPPPPTIPPHRHPFTIEEIEKLQRILVNQSGAVAELTSRVLAMETKIKKLEKKLQQNRASYPGGSVR
jgi:hypothetical protein